MAEISFAPAELDLVDVPRGDSLFGTLTVTEGGVAVDVSAYTWRAQVRETPDDADVLMSFTVGDDDAADGILTLTLAAADWPSEANPLPDPARWYWDLEGTSGTAVKTFLAGKFKLKADVSRA